MALPYLFLLGGSERIAPFKPKGAPAVCGKGFLSYPKKEIITKIEKEQVAPVSNKRLEVFYRV
jgi:hypothetical protein